MIKKQSLFLLLLIVFCAFVYSLYKFYYKKAKNISNDESYAIYRNEHWGFEIKYSLNHYAPLEFNITQYEKGVPVLRLYQNPPPIEFGKEFWMVVYDNTNYQTSTLGDWVKNLDNKFKNIKEISIGRKNCVSAQKDGYNDALGIEIKNQYYFCVANRYIYMIKFNISNDVSVEEEMVNSINFFTPQ